MKNSSLSGSDVLVTHGVLLTIALGMIMARFYLRFSIHQTRKLLVSDLLMSAAWCAALATASFDIVFNNKGALEPGINVTLENYEASVEDFEYVAKMSWAGNIPFYAALYLCKLSLVAVYIQLFPIFMVKLRIALWLSLGYCVLTFLISLALQFFLCWPLERNWQVSRPERLCNSDVPALIFQICWALQFTGSIIIFSLPFFMIYKVQMRPAMLAGVYAVLSLGVLDISFSLVRFLTVQLTNEGDFRSFSHIEFWSALDMNVGLIVTCLPSLRPYLRRDFKSSSPDNSLPESHSHGTGQSIITNKKIAPDRNSICSEYHGQFKEIVSNEGIEIRISEEIHGHINVFENDAQIEGGRKGESSNRGRNSWSDDRMSNKSDIELIQLKSPT